MITLSYTTTRRKALDSAIAQVLSAPQQTMVRELLRAEDPMGPAPQAETVMYWLRLNMPIAAAKIEELLYPNE